MKRYLVILAWACILTAYSYAQVTVTASSPANGATVTSPVHVAASATSSLSISGWRVYVDNNSVYSSGASSSISTNLTMAPGAHSLVIRAWASNGTYGSSNLSVTVPSSTSTTTSAATTTTTTTTCSSTVSGMQYYVATTGSDSNNGSSCKPWATIAHANATVPAGATVHVAAGTYSAPISTTRSGTSSARIRYISDVKWGAKIRYTGTGAIWTNSANYIDIIGFDMSGSGRLGILNNGSNNNFLGNNIHDLTVSGGCTSSGGAGIDNANYTGANNNVIGNVIGNIGVAYIGKCATVQGIYLANKGGIIANNLVYGVAAVAIQQWHAASNSTIVNNTVFNSLEGILIGGGNTTMGVISDYNYVANNIVYSNVRYGVIEACEGSWSCLGTHNKYVNNLVYANGTNWVLKSATASGSITSNPLFVNYQANGTGNYKLQSSSPALGRGTSTNAPGNDITGGLRSGGIDLGSYQYNPIAQKWPWF